MRIATSTNLISFNRDGSKTEMRRLLAAYAKWGMHILDLNFCELLNGKSVLASDEYRSYVEDLERQKNQLGLIYNQAHAPYVQDRMALSKEAGKRIDDLLGRSIEICGLLSIPILVVHPLPGCGRRNRKKNNLDYFSPFVQKAAERNVRLAFENLTAGREITEITELSLLVDRFGFPDVGICYDFGHAHLRGHDIARDIDQAGDRLIATHVADNHGKTDEHLLPFYGTIDWESSLATLKRTGYEGDLTYECMFFNRNLPTALKPMAIRQARTVGDHLATLWLRDCETGTCP